MKIAFPTLLLFAALAAGQAPPQFMVHTVDGPLPPAPLGRIDADFSLQTAGEQPRQISGKELVALRQTASSLPRFLSQNVLLLNNGDRVPVEVRAPWRVQQDRFYFHPGAPLRSAKELDLSVNYVAALCLGQADPAGLEEQDQLLSRWLNEPRSRDVVLFSDGDRLEGTLKKLDFVNGANLDVNGRQTLIPLGRIRAIAFNTEFKARPRGKGPFAQMVLSVGGRLGFSQIKLEAGRDKLTGTTLFGSTIEVPLADVRAIDIRQGPAVYLSDLVPSKYLATPFSSVAWPLVKDAGVSGKPLQLAQDFFEKGLGMHSQSRVSYNLDGKYRWFETVVGLDERYGQMGRVRLKVLVDGKERSLLPDPVPSAKDASVLRTRQDGPLTIRLDVRGAKELVLAVEFADYADVQGHVNWGNARVIK